MSARPAAGEPRILVYSSLFPSPADPTAGVFIRERMFRVARHLPIVVVSPRPWSPFDGLIRRLRPRFRPPAPALEVQQGIRVYAPRFFSLPGVMKRLDSLFMALGSYATLRRLRREFGFDLIDAHFGYPDGHAASLLARWFRVPLAITLRGSEQVYVGMPPIRRRIRAGLLAAARVISVADVLRRLALSLGVSQDKAVTVGNGVDSDKFQPVDRAQARARWQIPAAAKVLVSVGRLVEGKGFHRVIDCLPALRERYPDLVYLVVGGNTGVDSMDAALRQQVRDLGLDAQVRFLGAVPHEDMNWVLSAADVFVLATRREGWANVFLEAMACGLPVVTTDVGGNAEVVSAPQLGEIVPFDDRPALERAVARALETDWDRAAIRAHAVDNSWDRRVAALCGEFRRLTNREA